MATIQLENTADNDNAWEAMATGSESEILAIIDAKVLGGVCKLILCV